MTEEKVGFLCNIASRFSSKKDNHKLLKSYYLTRCVELTRGYGLPMKYFSNEARCPNCCVEWSRDTQVIVQHHKSKFQTNDNNNIGNTGKKKSMQRYNEMVKTCTFCKKSTTIQLEKPEKQYNKKVTDTEKNQDVFKEYVVKNNRINNDQMNPTKVIRECAPKNKKQKTGNKNEGKKNSINVYSNAFDVFSLKNEKNTLSTAIKEPAKVIKNNKKRKDKFAGLCQKAVLASAKLKEQKQTVQKEQNKLSLFLKPST